MYEILSFIVVLSLLIFIHEMGHYLVARWNGVRVETFSIGFGPEIWHRFDKAGTRWRIAALPLGGYVKMFGDQNVASAGPGEEQDGMSAEERAVAFASKRLGQRAAIVAAGPIANFLLAIVLFAGLFTFVGQPTTQPVVGEVMAGSAAEVAGLVPGDRILTVEGRTIGNFDDLRLAIEARPGQPTRLEVERDGLKTGVTVTPVGADEGGRTVGRLGVRSTVVAMERMNPFSALWQGTVHTAQLTVQTLVGVGEMITGHRSTEELGGPIRIAQLTGEVAQMGILPLIQLAALLSINLGLINLFPIPVLDGGHLMFYAAEALRGKPLGRRAQEAASMVGLGLILALMVFATWNDLAQNDVFRTLGSFFS